MVFMPFILGKLSEKYQRKNVLILSSIGQICVAAFLLGFGNTILNLIIGNTLLGTVNSLYWPAVESFVSQESGKTEAMHQRSFFNYCLAWTFGSGIAPLIGGTLADIDAKYAFLFSFIAYCIALLLTILLIPRENQKKAVSDNQLEPVLSNENHQKPNLSSENRIKMQIMLLLVILINTMSIKVLMSYFPNYAGMTIGLGWTGELIGKVTLGFGIGRVSYYLFGRYFEIKFRNIPYALALIGIMLVLLTSFTNPILIGVFYIVSGLCAGLLFLTSLEILLKYERKSKSTVAGMFESFIGFGAAITPLIAGWLASFSLILPFIVFAIIVFIVLLMSLIFKRKMEI
jgi:MFS family permease